MRHVRNVFPHENAAGEKCSHSNRKKVEKHETCIGLAHRLRSVVGVTATSSFAADKVVIKMAGMKPDGEPETLGMRKFGEILKELSGGKYDVQVFPNSQLGKEDAYIASTRKGIIQMCATGTQTSAIQPSMAMLETPMLFDDYAHARRAMNGGKTFELITNGFTEKSGMRVLNAFLRGSAISTPKSRWRPSTT